MTKLLLNTGLTPLYTDTGAPVPPGHIVLDDEMAPEHEALYDEGVLVYVRPGDVPDDAENLTAAARAHITPEPTPDVEQATPRARRGNAAPAVSDDAGVTESTERGGQS